MKLEVSLFKFDHQSDYLPYYTKHFINAQEQQTLLDILQNISNEHALGFEASEDFLVCVNGLYTSLALSVEQIKADFGSSLTIEPISIRRAFHDLLVDESDFNEKFDLLSEFASLQMLSTYIDPQIKALYQSYKIYFYASNTMNIEYNYIGDAILLLAYDLIEKYPKQEAQILEVLHSQEFSIAYHTSLENRIYNFDASIEEKIKQLKTKLNSTKALDEQNFKLNRNRSVDFGSFSQNSIKHDFKDFNLAYYSGLTPCEKTVELLEKLSASTISLDRAKDDLALQSFHLNKELGLKLASNIMLEAFDKSADLLIVDNEETFYLMDFNRKELERLSGREVKIPILHKNELSQLAVGEHEAVKKSLKQHAIDPELI